VSLIRVGAKLCSRLDLQGNISGTLIYMKVFNGKTRANNKPKTKGNKEQNDGQTDSTGG